MHKKAIRKVVLFWCLKMAREILIEILKLLDERRTPRGHKVAALEAAIAIIRADEGLGGADFFVNPSSSEDSIQSRL
jgi:hypothetical protein